MQIHPCDRKSVTAELESALREVGLYVRNSYGIIVARADDTDSYPFSTILVGDYDISVMVHIALTELVESKWTTDSRDDIARSVRDALISEHIAKGIPYRLSDIGG